MTCSCVASKENSDIINKLNSLIYDKSHCNFINIRLQNQKNINSDRNFIEIIIITHSLSFLCGRITRVMQQH